ncbi:MAG: polysaccharide lyase family protein [Ignavibacteriaceae bacterium]
MRSKQNIKIFFSNTIFFTGIIGAFLLIFCQVKIDAQQIVWQIGKFNHSSHEFHYGRNEHGHDGFKFHKGRLIYDVRKSNWQKDWPAYLPASANGATGYEPHPYTIRFNLHKNPTGLYIVKIGFTNIDLFSPGLRAIRSLSILQININGHVGCAYQHPRWHGNSGDKYWEDVIEVVIPTYFLKRGNNTLALIAINETPDSNSNSGFYFDALELTRDTDKEFNPREITVNVEPTIFYKQNNDKLMELVDVFVSFNSQAEERKITLSIDGQEYRSTLINTLSFGEQKVEFEVPEFTSETKGVVSIISGQQTKKIPVKLIHAKKWNVFMVPSVHLDIGFTDYRAKVAELHSEAIDEVMELTKTYPDFNYSPDGYWILQKYMENRNAAEKKELINYIHSKQIFVPAQYASLLTGFSSLETLIRSLYPSFEFTKDYDLPFNYANITDVPSYSWSYASVLAAAKIKYFIAASNNGHAPIFTLGSLDEESPFWWEGPDNGKVLMWYTKYYAQIAHVFGMDPDIEVDRDVLPRLLEMYTRPNYKSDAILLDGSQFDNTELNPKFASIAEDWNSEYAYPKLKYSGFAEAMKYIAKQFGNDIPIIKGDGGPYWEDGIASDAKYASIERETERRALSAEKLSTISSLLNPHIKIDKKLDNDLWQNILLYNEHNWGSSDEGKDPHSLESIKQLKTKHLFVKRAEEDCTNIIRSSMASIMDNFNISENTLVTFNTLNWKRSGIVETDIPKDYDLFDKNNNQVIPTEVVFTGSTFQRIRFETGDIPPLGFKIFSLKRIKKRQENHPVRTNSNIIENKYYRIILDENNGMIKSIIDRQLNKELVNLSSPYHFGQYIYVTSNDKVPVQPEFKNEIKINKASQGHLISVTKLPYGIEAVLQSLCVNTPKIETKIILFDRQKKIEFDYHIIKDKVYSKEAAYIAFPFSMNNPEFKYDTQNGIINPAKDMLPGAGQEWFSVQHFVSINQNGIEAELVQVNSPLVTLGDIVRGKWPAHFGKRGGTIFSYIMNNYWRVNYPSSQGGGFTFKYVLTSGTKISNSEMSRFGWSETTPIEIDKINKNKSIIEKRRLDLKPEGSYLNINSNDIVLVNWKRSEDNHGTIMRFLEVGGKTEKVKVNIPSSKIKSVIQCDAVERNIRTLPFTNDSFIYTIRPYQILTIRIQ